MQLVQIILVDTFNIYQSPLSDSLSIDPPFFLTVATLSVCTYSFQLFPNDVELHGHNFEK